MNEINDTTIVNQDIKNQRLHTLYVQNTFNPINNFSFTIGLRNNHYSLTGKNYLEPRASFTYSLNSHWSLKGATGKYYQFINQSNTKNALEGSRDFWFLANDDRIPIQNARHYLLGIDYQKPGLLVNVNYFRKDFDGLVEYAFRNGGLLTEFRDSDRIFAKGTGVSEGIEVLIKKNTKKLDAWLSYTLSEVKYTFPQLNNGQEFYADHDQRHELNLFTSYKHKRFNFFATWVLGSGTPYSEIGSTDSNAPGGEGNRPSITRLELKGKNNLRFTPYHRLDVGSTYHFRLAALKGSLTLSIFNLYDRKNVQDIQVDVIKPPRRQGERRDPVLRETEINSLGVTPNFSVRIDF
jgi:outer membrane receptor for ferrienterochelin and colicin